MTDYEAKLTARIAIQRDLDSLKAMAVKQGWTLDILNRYTKLVAAKSKLEMAVEDYDSDRPKGIF